VSNHLPPKLNIRRYDADGLTMKLTTFRNIPEEQGLAGRPGHMFISIKNRAFSDKLISRWCAYATRLQPRAFVTVVDEPYLHNIAAQTEDPDERRNREQRLFQLADERARQVQRILRRPGNEGVEAVSWSDIAKQVPQWLTDEMYQAYGLKGKFYTAVRDHCRATIADYDNAVSPEAFEKFFLEEAPVLVFAYYLFEGGVADFYPGPQPGVLWRIEEGVFLDEMPRVSALAQKHSGLLYGDIMLAEKAQEEASLADAMFS
jgi:hypothetical protein